MGVVIIGAGQAGVQAADSLRSGGYDGAVTLVAGEAGLPYQRPPLSKDWLMPDSPEPALLPLRPAEFFDRENVTLLHAAAEAIDRSARTVQLGDGRELSYEHLVLATGSRPRPLPAPGADLPGILQLRTAADAAALRAGLGTARSVVVVGAGFIGLEVAAAARAHGCKVTVLEFAPRPMARALTPRMGQWFVQAHADLGIDLRLGEGINAFTAGPDGRVAAAVSTSGAEYPADLVVVGVGVLPNQELAEAAGLETGNGIVVDAGLRTADPRIFAVGDAAAFPGGPDGALVRLESVPNAVDQGRHVAAAILGSGEPYRSLPWFWSTQGPYRLQMAGLALPDDETVLLGRPEDGAFAVLCFRGGVLAAVETVNLPSEHLGARKLLEAGAQVTPADAAAAEFSLRGAAKAARRARA